MPVKYDREKVPTWLRRFCPNEQTDRLTDLSFDHLKHLGVKAVGLDLDNTLTPWKSYESGEGVEDWLKGAQEAGLRLVIISNSRRKKRLAELSERYGIPYVKGPMKPRRDIFHTALTLVKVKPGEMAMIGDQMFTDIWGGNRVGVYTIWVAPMHPKEFIGTRVSRQFEKIITRLLLKYAR